MRLQDWLSFFEHELNVILRTQLIGVIFTWMLLAFILTLATCLYWVSPHIGIFLMYWPTAAVCGVAVGVVGILPILLLRRCLARRVQTAPHRRAEDVGRF